MHIRGMGKGSALLILIYPRLLSETDLLRTE